MALTKLYGNVTKNDASGLAMTSAAADSTGYTHVVTFMKWEGGDATFTLSDNKGSSGPTNLTKISHSNGLLAGHLTWMPLTAPGTGHTFTGTLSISRTWRRMIVWLVNSTTLTLALDVEAGAQDAGASATADAGTLTPTTDTVSFMAVGEYAARTYTPSAGWTEDVDSSVFGGSSADVGTLDPTCSIVGGTMNWICVAASFKEQPSIVGSYRGIANPSQRKNPKYAFRATNQGNIFPPLVLSPVVFRKTLSGIGTKTGSRQTHHT